MVVPSDDMKVAERDEGIRKPDKVYELSASLSRDIEVMSGGSRSATINLDTNASRAEVQEVILNNDNAPDGLSDCLKIKCTISESPKEECLKEMTSSITEPEGSSNPIVLQEDLPNVDTADADNPRENLSPNAGDVRDIPSKKLSASAAPFNPSPAVILSPVAVSLPPSSPIPAVTTWPLNITLHPGPTDVIPAPPHICASPRHPYPSSTWPPNLIHPLPFVYPPYTQPQAMPSRTYAMNSNMFHPNQNGWQCNINQSASEYVPGTIWPSCHPVTNPISDFMLGPIVQSDRINCVSTPLVSNAGEETKEEGDGPVVLESVKTVAINLSSDKKEPIVSHENETDAAQLKSGMKHEENKEFGAEKLVLRNIKKYEGEGSFSIFIKGRSRRKQSLRMPISFAQ